MKKFFLIFLFPLFAFPLAFFAGCYSLGSHGELPFATITVMPVKSEIDYAQTQALLAKNVIEQLSREPNLTAVPENGDAELFIVLDKITRSAAIKSNYNSHVNVSDNVTITAKISLRSRRGNADGSEKWYFRNRSVSAKIQVHSSDLNSTLAYPAISRELARKIRDTVVSTW